MTEWPTYDTPIKPAAPAVVERPTSRREHLPAWAGITLAFCLCFVIIATVLAVNSTLQLAQARNDIAQLNNQVSGMRDELSATKQSISAVQGQVTSLDGQVQQLTTAQTNLRDSLQAVAAQAQNAPAQQPGSGTLFDWAQLLAPLFGN